MGSGPRAVLKVMVVSLGLAIGLVPPALADATGGATFSAPPAISRVQCLSGCGTAASRAPSVVAVRPGGTVRILGHDLGAVSRVVFLGRPTGADDRRGRLGAVTATHLDVTLPTGVQTGPLRV